MPEVEEPNEGETPPDARGPVPADYPVHLAWPTRWRVVVILRREFELRDKKTLPVQADPLDTIRAIAADPELLLDVERHVFTHHTDDEDFSSLDDPALVAKVRYLEDNYRDCSWRYLIVGMRVLATRKEKRSTAWRLRTPVPWEGQSTGRDWLFPMRDPSDPTMVSYYASAKHLQIGRRSTASPGRVLSRFYTLSPHELKSNVEQFIANSLRNPYSGDDYEMKILTDPDEIYDAYLRGPSSCMTANQAVRAYGAGDLGLAVLRRRNGDHVMARAIVYPEKLLMNRVYPSADYDHMPILQALKAGGAHAAGLELWSRLLRLGYLNSLEVRKSRIDNRSWNGARMLMFKEKSRISDHRQFSAPYLDHNLHVRYHPDGVHLMLNESNGWRPDDCGRLYIPTDVKKPQPAPALAVAAE